MHRLHSSAIITCLDAPRSTIASLWKKAILCVALSSWGTAAFAGTVIDVSGPNDATLAVADIAYPQGVGFSLAKDYTNVQITVPLVSFESAAGGSIGFSFYLRKSIGPGAAPFDGDTVTVASGGFFVAGSALSPPYTLTDLSMSALSLPAGQYYLVLTGTSSATIARWASSPASVRTVVANDGAIVTDPALSAGGDIDPFPPASVFGDGSGAQGYGFWFRITGDLVDTGADVPEPATIFLLAAAVPLLFYKRRLNGN
ncbi:MAG: PEP-CTERM sorting domain-containing protein [Acidobacteria bacterium]|nr:PEP-CTERM sorting domain-containing protein [Acidobacteriota bacterium]